MRCVFASVFVAAVFAVGANATDAKLPDIFLLSQTMCDETAADPGKALAIADAAGWEQVPQAMRSMLPQEKFEHVQMRMLVSGSTRIFLMVADSDMEGAPSYRGLMCSITSLPGGIPDFEPRLSRYTAVPVQRAPTGKFVFTWNEQDGKHINITPAARNVGTLIARGTLRLVSAYDVGQVAVIMVVVPAAKTTMLK